MDRMETNILLAVETPREAARLSESLSDMGVTVTVAENGLAALKRLKHRAPSLLVADVALSQLSGIRLLGEVRRDPALASLPVILIGGDADEKERRQAQSLGASGFLARPFSLEALEDLMDMALGRGENPEALANAADEMLAAKQPQEALEQYQHAALAGANHLANLYTDMSLALESAGRLDEALESLDQAVEIAPVLMRPLAVQGRILAAAGRFDEAWAVVQKALNLEPESTAARLELAEALLFLDRDAEAEKVFLEVLKIRPDHAFALNRLGITFRRQKKYDQAVAHYLRALEANSEDENLHFNLGRCYLEMGRLDETRKSLEQALTLSPDLAEAKDLLARLQK